MTAVTLRLFRYPEDYDAVFSLWQNAGEGIGIGFSDQPAEIEKKLRHAPDLFLLAEAEGRIIGSVIGGFDGRRGMVYHLAVAAEYREQGIGGLLMDEIEARLKAKGCGKAYLLVKQGNRAADFYEKRGWNAMSDIRLFGKNL
jgi:ribosomal protein S18 acetylase RimI-like enzyme